MTGAMIAQLIIALGPSALKLAEDLAAVWNKELTVDEVLVITGKARKNYDQYIADAKAALQPPKQT